MEITANHILGTDIKIETTLTSFTPEAPTWEQSTEIKVTLKVKDGQDIKYRGHVVQGASIEETMQAYIEEIIEQAIRRCKTIAKMPEDSTMRKDALFVAVMQQVEFARLRKEYLDEMGDEA